jgi:hypothetical protein
MSAQVIRTMKLLVSSHSYWRIDENGSRQEFLYQKAPEVGEKWVPLYSIICVILICLIVSGQAQSHYSAIQLLPGGKAGGRGAW